jgi:hypothetical protein
MALQSYLYQRFNRIELPAELYLLQMIFDAQCCSCLECYCDYHFNLVKVIVIEDGVLGVDGSSQEPSNS